MIRIKRRLKKKRKIIFLAIVLIFLIFYIKEHFVNDGNNNIIEETKIDYTKYITDSSESNKEYVNEYISKGMTLSQFKDTLSRDTQYVDKKGTYKQINYNFENHLSYSELEEIYEELNKSDIVKLEIIGKSYDGRNLYSIEIGEGSDISMFEGNIHGAEIAPALYLTKFAVDLVNGYENKSSEIVELLTNHKVVILPSVNPDGYDYSINGKDIINDKTSYVYTNDSDIEQDYFKANINGVDLNRNLPSQNGGLYFKNMYLYYTVSREKSTERLSYFPGDSLGSEPETQALIYWMYKHYSKAHAYISVHSAGRVIYNGKQYLSDRFNDLSEKCAQTVRKHTGYYIIGIEYDDDGRGTDGTSTDMIAEIAHGYKYNEDTGRLSTSKYAIKANTMEQELCVITVETLDSYTQNLSTIKDEWNSNELGEAFKSLVELQW